MNFSITTKFHASYNGLPRRFSWDKDEDMYVVFECADVENHITVDNADGGGWYAE